MNPLLHSMLEHGAYTVLSDFEQQTEITALARELIIDAVSSLQGERAASAVRKNGLETLHLHLPASQIGALRDRVMVQLRPRLLGFACAVGRGLLGIEEEFFVDDYTILRVNYPYEAALNADHSSENPGIGRVDPNTRNQSSSTQRRDPVYAPKEYHRHTPPASWAHGPHKDTWTGHSRDGINLWWAISRVSKENSMIFYPGTFKKSYEVDPRSLYLAQGFPLPAPRKMALHEGEMLIFNPELLHATHLNTTPHTRIALSARINPRQPRFNPNCFYAREFWHSSTDLEAGRTDAIRQFARAEHFEASEKVPAEQPAERRNLLTLKAELTRNGQDCRLDLSHIPESAERILVLTPQGQRVLLLRSDPHWQAVQEVCPHLDISLADGHFDGKNIHCPAHGVSFRTNDGKSACKLLKLQTWKTTEEDGWLHLIA
ncbi:Rieske 2Fe-2S domain-containing protein [Diaphorobacter sp. HDW4B]|uniref:Rieske 2Fe-2S domain-containing protein n=1 Tax=Diaphorobacter sp. HDW4B TaxID=2714925 RepID=UPI00140DE203|nr:Rieske 2Fe-2S domain-containing protein [Diaphorobacter sp. HDW4B]QIL73222.1 Rieske 2Fe-2S domain-containing protein [Diaphorobacter sp. HDW4B]